MKYSLLNNNNRYPLPLLYLSSGYSQVVLQRLGTISHYHPSFSVGFQPILPNWGGAAPAPAPMPAFSTRFEGGMWFGGLGSISASGGSRENITTKMEETRQPLLLKTTLLHELLSTEQVTCFPHLYLTSVSPTFLLHRLCWVSWE